MPLMAWQIPGLLALSVHGFHRVCALRLGGEPQVEGGRDLFRLRGFDPSAVPQINLSTRG